jgi:NCS1 family nucleobase:cation symporter-1
MAVTQINRGDVYELTDEATASLASSKYFNNDIRPTVQAERTWGTYNISMLWVGMSICIPSFMMASGLVGMGLSVWASVFNVVLGNVLILIPIQLNSYVGTKYGISFPVFSRLTFGMKGAHIASVSRAITACGWCAVQCGLGGTAIMFCVQAFVPSLDISTPVCVWVGFLLFLFMTWLLTAFGEKIIRVFEAIGSPVLIVMSIGLLIWAFVIAGNAGYSVGDVFSTNITSGDTAATRGGAFAVFLIGLTNNIGFWATMALNIPDFSRYAKNQKAQFRGQLYGMPIMMAVCAVIGAVYAQATFLADITGNRVALFSPVDALAYIGTPGTVSHSILLLVLGIGVIIATLTTNIAANVVAPGNGFSNLSPKRISYFWGVTIACVIAVVYQFLLTSSDTLSGAMFTFLNIYGGILAPFAAILIIDYWVHKKQRVEVIDLYREGSDTRYYYQGGFNSAAIIAWIAGAFVPTLYSIVATAAPSSAFVQNAVLYYININSYLWAFLVAFIVYLLIGKGSLTVKSILTQDELDAVSRTEKSGAA